MKPSVGPASLENLEQSEEHDESTATVEVNVMQR